MNCVPVDNFLRDKIGEVLDALGPLETAQLAEGVVA